MPVAKTRVLVVDDSATIRQLMLQIINSAPDLMVVGVAPDPYVAWEKIKALNPDVLTLDVEMPRMDGVTFLERLMKLHPMPVVMVSSLTESGCATTLRALEVGAVDFVTKPKVDVRQGTLELGESIIEKVRGAARARVKQPKPKHATVAARERPALSAMIKTTERVVAIGSSTGGTEALREVLVQLPADAPPIVIVQHMPPGFTRAFAARLDSMTAVRVKEAEDGDRLFSGRVLLAPGDFHVALHRSGADYSVKVFSGERVNHHRPSVDVLFESFAKYAGANAVGVILTGMGNDGAHGMLKMRTAGARTFAQDEESCVVFGMPREAIALGGAEAVLPLNRMPGAILQACT
jgi:two-component system chemotaxis response regulator CheB